jgi:hypothetical protein
LLGFSTEPSTEDEGKKNIRKSLHPSGISAVKMQMKHKREQRGVEVSAQLSTGNNE